MPSHSKRTVICLAWLATALCVSATRELQQAGPQPAPQPGTPTAVLSTPAATLTSTPIATPTPTPAAVTGVVLAPTLGITPIKQLRNSTDYNPAGAPPPAAAVAEAQRAAAVANGNGVRRSGNRMIYHGGDIIPGKVTINLILYGDWSVFKVGNDAQEIITNFVENLGTSSYWRTATGYYDTDDFVKANIVLGGVFYDRFSTGFGTSLDYAALPAIVQNAIQTGFGGVADYNALYVVITDPDVTNSYGFCSEFCAYHTFYSDGDQAVKYTFVGNPATQCYYSCAPQDDPSQPTANGNPGIDALTSSLAHEIAEAITDPKPFTTWYDQNRLEIADKCAYNYILDPLPTVANGGQYNVALGNRRYLLQGLWVNDLGGYCDILPTY